MSLEQFPSRNTRIVNISKFFIALHRRKQYLERLRCVQIGTYVHWTESQWNYPGQCQGDNWEKRLLGWHIPHVTYQPPSRVWTVVKKRDLRKELFEEGLEREGVIYHINERTVFGAFITDTWIPYRDKRCTSCSLGISQERHVDGDGSFEQLCFGFSFRGLEWAELPVNKLKEAGWEACPGGLGLTVFGRRLLPWWLTETACLSTGLPICVLLLYPHCLTQCQVRSEWSNKYFWMNYWILNELDEQ